MSAERNLLTRSTYAEFRTGKASDIVSTLVSIYESRTVIVEELQSLLAQKLLAVQNYELEKEVSLPLIGLQVTQWRVTLTSR